VTDDAAAHAPAPARRGGRPRSTRAHEAILEATIEEWAEHSFAGMTIEGVAARAGVARTTVYRRWSSLAALAMDALNHIREHLPTPPGETVRDDLLVLLTALRHLLTRSRTARLIPQLVAEASRRPDLSLTYWNEHLARGTSAFGDVLRRGMAEGSVRPDVDVELAIDLLTGPLFKRSIWQLPTSDDDLTCTIDIVLAGLAPHAQPDAADAATADAAP
jgi:AcrR family transcriptional regulator